MSIKVTFEFATTEEAITAIAKLRGPEAAAPKPAGAKAKAEAAASAPTASAPPAAAHATLPTSANGPTYADVAALITDKVKTHRAEVVAALGKYNAKNGKELKEGDYVAFSADLEKMSEALA